MDIFSEKSRIKSYHVDKAGKLSKVQVFNFLQEAAFRHSVLDKFGQPDLDNLGMVWVLSRIKVVFLKEVELGETIEINSWVKSINGALSERDFELTCHGEPIIKATSLWICLDMQTIRPVRIPKNIMERMSINEEQGSTISPLKIRAINKNSTSQNYTIQTSDIDMVNHTNNVVYVRIGLNGLTLDNQVKEMDINYLNQSFEGEVLDIKTEVDSEDEIVQEITKKNGGIVCRLRYTF